MTPGRREPPLLDLVITGTTLLLATLAFLCGSAPLGVLSLVGGAISLGVVIGARRT